MICDPSRCFKCSGPWSEATGHVFQSGVRYCGRCAREFFGAFYRPRMIRMSRPESDFAAAAMTSIGREKP